MLCTDPCQEAQELIGGASKLLCFIYPHRIQIIREIGRGAWGSIFEGKYKDQLVAIKQPHQLILTPETIDRLQRGVQIMAQVHHPNLVRFIAAVFDELFSTLWLAACSVVGSVVVVVPQGECKYTNHHPVDFLYYKTVTPKKKNVGMSLAYLLSSLYQPWFLYSILNSCF